MRYAKEGVAGQHKLSGPPSSSDPDSVMNLLAENANVCRSCRQLGLFRLCGDAVGCCNWIHCSPQCYLLLGRSPVLTVPPIVDPVEDDQFHALKIAQMFFFDTDRANGFAIVPVKWRGTNYVYVAARAGDEEAVALFILYEGIKEVTLVTSMNLPMGGAGIYCGPVELGGQNDDVPNLYPGLSEQGVIGATVGKERRGPTLLKDATGC